MIYPFKNLVFEGGGMKGLAYVGALEVLEATGIYRQVIRVAGTSAGALFALLLALNYSPLQLQELLLGLRFNQFLDDSWGVLRDTQRLLRDYGWHKGEALHRFVEQILLRHTGHPRCTFAQLQALAPARGFRLLYITGSNLSTGFSEVFSLQHTPHMPIADALRISMSIPLFFTAPRGKRGDVYADGGVLDNYPLHLFDGLQPDGRPWHNGESLGFRLDSGQRISTFHQLATAPRRPIRHFCAYAHALLLALLNQQDNRHLHSHDWRRTVYIDTLGVGVTDFDLSPDRQQALIDSGRRHTLRYLEWYAQEKGAQSLPPLPSQKE